MVGFFMRNVKELKETDYHPTKPLNVCAEKLGANKLVQK